MIFHSTVQDTVPPTGIKTISKNKIQKMGKFVKRKTVRIFVSGCENYRSVDAGCGKGENISAAAFPNGPGRDRIEKTVRVREHGQKSGTKRCRKRPKGNFMVPFYL